MKHKDNHIVGIIIGLLLPMLGILVFCLSLIHRFDTIGQLINHFAFFKMWYKILTLALMPNVALFFIWNKKNKLNQARSVLLMTLFYGVFVVILYF